ncbi:ABC transporter permease [Pedobacter gandavensis]|uniref:FtsX-like permease family protein n=1 Tax=Pedobacter gandavensis TaxID=2679963 RepID=A0ABR6F051_9SPHI|nr:FtsX-like permease family protein [Pedobacter gandavensis]MBB2150073.1 FtsX-like permease family protein [Pedobacter gandavensis]
MFKNYFKIAIAVLKRRKFFTFISLFGISFTLTILMVLTSFIEVMLSPNYPDVNRDRELFITRVELRSSKEDYTMMGALNFYLVNNFIAKMKTPEKIAMHSNRSTTNAYPNNKKLSVDLMYTNLAFWEVYQFKFLMGKPFSEQQLKNAEQVVVISEDLGNNYFGEGVSALGKEIEFNNLRYKVIGVVKTAPATVFYAASDIYLPYTLDVSTSGGTSLMGSYLVTLLAKSADDLPVMQEEYQQLLKRVPHPEENEELLFSYADTYLESFTRYVLGKGVASGRDQFFLILSAVIFVFLLLPTVNLMNINVSRIMERSSEIGVRKAFGASSRTLVGQFLVENLILTLLGGLMGLFMAMATISILNSSGLIANLDLKINFIVVCYSLLACLVFGLMSGVYPAWRMSKLNVVTALKANN